MTTRDFISDDLCLLEKICSLTFLYLSLCYLLFSLSFIMLLMCRPILIFWKRYILIIYIKRFIASVLEKRASPGIEPGPPAPKAGILPLNYKAFLLYCSFTTNYLRNVLAFPDFCALPVSTLSLPCAVSAPSFLRCPMSLPSCAPIYSCCVRLYPLTARTCKKIMLPWRKKGFAGNRTRATRTQSGYFTT